MNHPQNILQWRRDQRAGLLARRMAVPAQQRRQWNGAITRLLLDGFPALRSMVVGAYWPFKGEFDPRFALKHWRDAGATTALPVVLQKSAPLEFRAWWPGTPTTQGIYDLPIPDGTEVLRPDALLIPPVGFDEQGYRLGYGGGYFDRTLAALSPRPLTIGAGFELCRMPTIHPQTYDIAMDFIVTEAGIYRVGPHGLDLCKP